MGGYRPWDFVGSSSSSMGNNTRNYMIGLEDEDAALERILALSLMVVDVLCAVSRYYVYAYLGKFRG